MRNDFDAKELLDELEELRDRHDDDGADLENDEMDRLKELTELDSDANLDSMVRNGESAIPQSDWLDYATDMMRDCYTIPKELENYIDYKSFADDLEMDYTEFEWEGVTYLTRMN